MTRRDALLLLTLGALWGAVFPLSVVVLHSMSAMAVVVARTALSAAVLLPLAARRGVLIRAVRRQPHALVAATVLQLTVPIVLLTAGQQHVSAGLAGILLATQPVWATVITAVLSRRLPPSAAVGVALGLTGCVLLFMRDLGASSAPLGGTLLLTAAAGYAAGAVYIQRRLADVPPLAIAAVAMTLSCVLLAPGLLLAPTGRPGPTTSVALIMLGTAATGGALLLFYHLIGRVGAVRANLAAYLAPAFAVVYDIPLGHLPSRTALLGLLLIVSGSAATAFSGVKES